MARMIADSMKVKDSGEMKSLTRGEKAACETAEHGAYRESRQFGVAGVDAERSAGDFVLAQCLPCAPDREPAQPLCDEIGDQRERQDDVNRET